MEKPIQYKIRIKITYCRGEFIYIGTDNATKAPIIIGPTNNIFNNNSPRFISLSFYNFLCLSVVFMLILHLREFYPMKHVVSNYF